MLSFENNTAMSELFQEFDKIDQFRDAFKATFNMEIMHILKQYFPNLKHEKALSELLNQYATHIINATESVIDKDKTYPEFRIQEELEKMLTLANKPINIDHNIGFKDDLNQKVKELMVENFKKIFDLSAYGFRLLEANAKVHNRHFIYMLHEQLQK